LLKLTGQTKIVKRNQVRLKLLKQNRSD